MQLKSIALLLIAVTLVLGQDATNTRERQRQLAASRRTKLIEQATAQRTTPVAAPKRRLVNRRPTARATEAPVVVTTTTTAAPPTTTEAPIATEPTFTDFTVFTDAPEVAEEPVQQVQQQQVQQEEEEIPSFRPRPEFRPDVRPQPRPQARPEVRPLEEELFGQEEVQPVRVQRPLAGPTRTRVQSNPQTFRAEAPVRAPALSKPAQTRPRDEELEVERKPFVETVRRYSFTGDDGSFTFGYENADGSFKEETRGVDCIVRGKYGYVDPDGIRREFSYQTGNACDPNAVQQSETGLEEEPAVRPVAARRPVARPANTPRPVVNTPRPAAARPVQQEEVQAGERRPLPTFQQSQAISQQNRNREPAPQQSLVEEEREIAQVIETPTRITRPQSGPVRPQPAPVRPQPPRVQQPAPQQEEEPAQLGVPRPQLTPFNLEEEVARFSGNSRPEIQSFQAPRPVAPRPTIERPIFDDNEEVFVERRPQPRPEPQPQREQQRPQLDLVQIPQSQTGTRSFATELVFDPRSNQFQTALQQRIPATNENLNFREQLIAFAPTTTTPRSIDEFVAPVRAPVAERPREQPREERPPQFLQQEFQPQQFQPQFQQPQRLAIEDQERVRQDQERRRQQLEEQRLADERQRIAEENERRRLTPAVQFVSGPPQNLRFVADSPFPGQFSPVAQQPQPQFFGPPPPQQRQQQQQPPRTIAEAERPSFASGQIDSFLSGLSG